MFFILLYRCVLILRILYCILLSHFSLFTCFGFAFPRPDFCLLHRILDGKHVQMQWSPSATTTPSASEIYGLCRQVILDKRDNVACSRTAKSGQSFEGGVLTGRVVSKGDHYISSLSFFPLML